MIKPPPQRIVWLYTTWQPLYEEIHNSVQPRVEFMKGIPFNLEEDNLFEVNIRNLIVLDGLAVYSKMIWESLTCTHKGAIIEIFRWFPWTRTCTLVKILLSDETHSTWCYLTIQWIDNQSWRSPDKCIRPILMNDYVMLMMLWVHYSDCFFWI